MTHGDDDGLVLPPKLAPAHVVILPIYRNDERTRDGAAVLRNRWSRSLTAQTYDGEPVRVRIDDRDIRGGEKKWQWVKRGVPMRVEIGPRDVAERQGVRRPPRRRPARRRARRAASSSRRIAKTLDEIQQALFDRAAASSAKRPPCGSTA